MASKVFKLSKSAAKEKQIASGAHSLSAHFSSWNCFKMITTLKYRGYLKENKVDGQGKSEEWLNKREKVHQ